MLVTAGLESGLADRKTDSRSWTACGHILLIHQLKAESQRAGSTAPERVAGWMKAGRQSAGDVAVMESRLTGPVVFTDEIMHQTSSKLEGFTGTWCGLILHESVLPERHQSYSLRAYQTLSLLDSSLSLLDLRSSVFNGQTRRHWGLNLLDDHQEVLGQVCLHLFLAAVVEFSTDILGLGCFKPSS